ncbi:MAG TPA: YihY/virulence factor BrkB family protein [Pyrinomonadaceae bacterium]|nr:YihY/virulence factor BrkB family protein [Pyrinomonadaceae bacterium]
MFKHMSLGEMSWAELGRRVYRETLDDDILGRAAQLSYFFLLALFPALLFLTAVLGLVAGEDSQIRQNLFGYLGAVLPSSAYDLVTEGVESAIEQSGGAKISFGILATLWAASNGMGAISQTLNVTYDVEETRPFWKTRLTAILLTLALGVLIIAALVLVLYGHDLGEWVARAFGLGTVFEVAWKVIQWPIVFAFITFAFGLIYYFAPDIKDPAWKWITPGAVIGVLLWLAISFGFKLYLSYFNSYSATYGTLGAVIVLMLWFYFTGVAILLGGEINSEIEHAAAEQGAPGAKEAGEKTPGDGRAGGARSGGGQDSRAGGGRDSSQAGGSAAARVVDFRPARVTRLPPGPKPERSFSVGKFAVVLGAWLVGKVTGGGAAGSGRRRR